MSEQAGGRPGPREQNQLRILDALRQRSEASRAEIALATGLSRAAVSVHVARLQSQGLVAESSSVERDDVSTGRGRRPTMLRLNASAGVVVAMVFDRGGLRAAISDLSYSLIAERSAPVVVYDLAGLRGVEPGEALDAAARLALELLADVGVARDSVIGVGLGLPAPIDRRRGTVAGDTILHRWKDVHAAAELTQRLQLPVELDNDANLGALGELLFGAGRGLRDFIYVKQSPGVGSALILDGRLYRGASGIAGELGHIQVQAEGPICDGCGQRGCLNTIVSGTTLVEVLRSSHGSGLSSRDIPALVAAGDHVATRIVGDAGRMFGRVLADLCNELNPEAIIVQGELSTPDGPFLQGIREGIDRGAIPAAAAAVTVKPSLVGERAELLGAAALVIANIERLPSSRLLALARSRRARPHARTGKTQAEPPASEAAAAGGSIGTALLPDPRRESRSG
jgi:predicted NBD/HSP70 family sugar kinase